MPIVEKVEVQSAIIAAMETQMARLNQKVIELTHEDNMAHIEKVMGITPNQTTFPNNTTTHSVDVPNATTSSTSRITAKSMPANADKKFVGMMVRVATKLEVKYATPVEKRVGSYFMRRQKFSDIVPEKKQRSSDMVPEHYLNWTLLDQGRRERSPMVLSRWSKILVFTQQMEAKDPST